MLVDQEQIIDLLKKSRGEIMYHATLPKSLMPIHAKGLLSLGGSFDEDGSDGRYILTNEAIDATQVLVSFGVNDDWSFEEAIFYRTGAQVHAYDKSTKDRFIAFFTLRRLFFCRKKLYNIIALLRSNVLKAHQTKTHDIKKNLSKKFFPRRDFYAFFDNKKAFFHAEFIGPLSDGYTPVGKTLKPHSDKKVMLKMDIEGGEYEVLEELKNLPSNVHVFLAEFHGLNESKKLDALLSLISSLKLKLVHVHANNCAPPNKQGGVPPVLELTFIADQYFEASGEAPSYPIAGLDLRNSFNNPDYEIQFVSSTE